MLGATEPVPQSGAILSRPKAHGGLLSRAQNQ